MDFFIASVVFIFGIAIGSFLNVCIYRLPKEQSIVKPPSHCTHCRKYIKWYDNIPLLSYILLGGKCRFCKTKISPRYILVELLTGLVFLSLYLFFGISVKLFIFAILFASLIVSTFIDFEYQIIPDFITYPGMVLGLIVSIIYPELHSVNEWYIGLLQGAKGLLAGGLSIYATGLIGTLIFRKDAMGGGDVKLMAMIGVFVGWKYALLIFFLAPFFGAAVGIFMKIKYKAEVIPYGPYLSLASVVVVYYGNPILKYLFY